MHRLRAYTWCAVYFLSICLSDTCGKHLISGLQWRSMRGPVLYTNLLATPVMLMFGIVGGEGPKLIEAQWRQRDLAVRALVRLRHRHLFHRLACCDRLVLLA